MKKMNLIFDGYCKEGLEKLLPKKSGIYFVYRGVPYPNETVDIKELIYIGKADDINQRFSPHDKHDLFVEQCAVGEYVYYSYVLVRKSDLDIVENALVYNLKPVLNDKLKYKYNHTESVRLRMGGQCSELFGSTICVDVKANGAADTYMEEVID